MLKIAIYGKGGIGKSTTVSNLSAALADSGYRVMQIGCDPKADSTKCLVGGKRIPTVLDKMREKGDEVKLEDICFMGYKDVVCVESGGPTPGIGCAGKGIIASFQLLEDLHAYEIYQPDIVLYDVLGDVVCGGFAMPIRGGYADYVAIVTSGEMMALFAADNISRAIKSFGNRGYAKLAGYIQNSRNVENENSLVDEGAKEAGTEVIYRLQRSEYVQKAESVGQTVVEAFPECEMAEAYRHLARTLLNRTQSDKEGV